MCIRDRVYTMTTPSTTEKMIYSDVVDLFNKEEVESFVITGSEIVITKRGVDPASPDATVSYELFSVDYFLYQMMDTIDQQHAEGIIKDYDLKTGFVAPWWVSMIPVSYTHLFPPSVILIDSSLSDDL